MNDDKSVTTEVGEDSMVNDEAAFGDEADGD
jgi:hypothetical protein